MNIQSCSSCTDICCERTTYKLTNEDFKQLLEVRSKEFVVDATILNIDGTIQLKKPCWFLTVTNRCVIYNHRPLGCRIYPVVWNNGVTVDTVCQGHREILHPERHSILIHKYMHTIAREAKERKEQ